MSVDYTQSWAYAEDVCQEDAITIAARQMAREFSIPAVSPAVGAFLQTLAAASRVHSAVEVGTGTGVSGLYLLGASSDISLTTIDIESEAQQVAREAFGRAGIRPGRTRLINGRSADILPRLASSSYDFVLVDGDPMEAAGDVQEALRILRPGGTIVLARALCGGKVPDPARREEDVVAIRSLGKELLDAAELRSSLIPIGDGVLLAVVR
ncbi:MAG: O-methyltransferase [Ancrocorticia sp.]|jgi:predicted O-methyltransferase YrrM|nr:O-methyltransferase [Ancrocorticia sp.]MCI1896743.1 O-methyltransferase [Ancrocorticia sp.]MCI1933447.1 O-methyltransferase [Ancrocorticia sp.]MCI1963168.1 O-methyltransferase [Ancrocorticia sp.]MCI2001536.1 O-methyltransferase [Ancrocorticia sp.]